MPKAGKNHKIWAEFKKNPLFNPQINPNAAVAINWLEKLQEEGGLKEIDIYNVEGLINCATAFKCPKREMV